MTQRPTCCQNTILAARKGCGVKYFDAYQQGHTVRVHQDDGSVTTQYFTLEEGAVMLAPDVRECFPDAESVNQALRGLIGLIPHQARQRKREGSIARTG